MHLVWQFKYDKIGSYCWGFVCGMTYTTEPWDDFRKKYKENPDMDFDFTKWQHDLIRRDYLPYDPREIELIRRCNERVDKKIRFRKNILYNIARLYYIARKYFSRSQQRLWHHCFSVWRKYYKFSATDVYDLIFSGQIVYKRVFLKDLLKKKILYWVFYKNL